MPKPVLKYHPAWPVEQAGIAMRPSIYDTREGFITNVAPISMAAIYFGNFGTTPQDVSLSRQALFKLSFVARHFLQPAGLKASVQLDTLTLSGNVASETILTLAQIMAMEIDGITKIERIDLLVQPQAPVTTYAAKSTHLPTDIETHAKANLLLATDQTISLRAKVMTVQKNLAFIEGEVTSEQQKTWAEQLLASAGMEVSSNLTILAPNSKVQKSAVPLDDESLQALVKFRLALVKNTSTLSLRIRALRGVVTLSGKVSNESLRQQVENLVRSTLGVTELRSSLTLEA